MELLEQDGIRLLKVERPEEVIPYRAGFVGAYQTIFRGAPYHEMFSPSEAEGVLMRILSTPGHLTILAVRGRTKVVGFGCGVPLVSRPDVYRDMHGLLPLQHTFYLAELGILPQYRGRGIGRLLVEKRLEMVDPQVYTHVVLRTSARNDLAYQLYEKMEFEDMGVYQEVASRRVNGSVRTDRRLFLSRVLHPAAQEE